MLNAPPLIIVLSNPSPEHRQFLQANLNGITLALETVGNSTFQLEYIKLTPDHNLVNDILDQIDKKGALAIIGPFDSETAELVIPKSTQLGIPVLSTGASSPLLNRGNLSATTFFRFGNSDFENVRQLVHWLATDHPSGTILTVAETRTPLAHYGDDNLVVLQQLALPKSLSVIPVRFERGMAESAVADCHKILREKGRSVSAIVALGYTADTLSVFRALYKEHSRISMYTINPQRSPYEKSGLEGIMAVTSDFEYANTSFRHAFQRQFLSRFTGQREAEFHGSAIYAYDLVYILSARIAEAKIFEMGNIKLARQKLIRQIADSHIPVEKTVVSSGIFTSNHEIPFHSRNIILRKGSFVEFDGRRPNRKWELFSGTCDKVWRLYRRVLEYFELVKSSVEFWFWILGIIIVILGLWAVGIERAHTFIEQIRSYFLKAT